MDEFKHLVCGLPVATIRVSQMRRLSIRRRLIPQVKIATVSPLGAGGFVPEKSNPHMLGRGLDQMKLRWIQFFLQRTNHAWASGEGRVAIGNCRRRGSVHRPVSEVLSVKQMMEVLLEEIVVVAI
jgi:hypothetical protein